MTYSSITPSNVPTIYQKIEKKLTTKVFAKETKTTMITVDLKRTITKFSFKIVVDSYDERFFKIASTCRTQATALIAKIESALDMNQFSVKVVGGTRYKRYLRQTIEISLKSAEQKDAIDSIKMYAEFNDVDISAVKTDDLLTHVFTVRGQRYRLVNINWNRPKYPVAMINVDSNRLQKGQKEFFVQLFKSTK